jgi:hypothetical protein
MTDPVKLFAPQPARGVYLKLFVVPPPCPRCGPGTMVCPFDTTRDAWKAGIGWFACRRCGFSGVWRVPARIGPSLGDELYPGLEAWVYDLGRSLN